jgi:hypothetical protein
MIIVFTDEAGDDWNLAAETTNRCLKLAMPVYIVGRPALFGRLDAFVGWTWIEQVLDNVSSTHSE